MKKLPVRDRLVATATQLFYEQGYNLTGINQILKKSGVAKASMYQHFRSKDELCVAYLQRMELAVMAELEGYLEEKPSGVARLTGLIDFLMEFFNKEYFRGCWCLNTLSEIPRDNELVMDEIQAQKQRFRDFIYDLIIENLDVQEAGRLANKLYLVYEAALVESQVFMEPWPIEEAREMYMILLNKAR
jgi:AcrR family transcriptional regulator